jgi:hypothetical protein
MICLYNWRALCFLCGRNGSFTCDFGWTSVFKTLNLRAYQIITYIYIYNSSDRYNISVLKLLLFVITTKRRSCKTWNCLVSIGKQGRTSVLLVLKFHIMLFYKEIHCFHIYIRIYAWIYNIFIIFQIIMDEILGIIQLLLMQFSLWFCYRITTWCTRHNLHRTGVITKQEGGFFLSGSWKGTSILDRWGSKQCSLMWFKWLATLNLAVPFNGLWAIIEYCMPETWASSLAIVVKTSSFSPLQFCHLIALRRFISMTSNKVIDFLVTLNLPSNYLEYLDKNKDSEYFIAPFCFV